MVPLVKKLVLTLMRVSNRNTVQCVCCEKFQDDSEEQIYRARSENCGKNLNTWAIESRNWVIHTRLNTAINAEDAVAGGVNYHTSCYTKLNNDAHAAKSKSSHAKRGSQVGCTYDPLVIAQLVAFVEFNHSTFKLADLRKLYDRRLNQLGSDWIGVYVHQ